VTSTYLLIGFFTSINHYFESIRRSIEVAPFQKNRWNTDRTP